MRVLRFISLLLIFTLLFSTFVFAGGDQSNTDTSGKGTADLLSQKLKELQNNYMSQEAQQAYLESLRSYVTDVREVNKGLRVFRRPFSYEIGFTVSVNKAINAIKYRSNIDNMFMHVKQVTPDEDLLNIALQNRTVQI